MSPVSFFLFVNIVRVMDIQLHIPIISLLSQTETFLQFLLKFLRDKYELKKCRRTLDVRHLRILLQNRFYFLALFFPRI